MPNGDLLYTNFEPASKQNQQGPLMAQILALDNVPATSVGWWKRWLFDKGSLEVTGSPTGTVRMLTSNAPLMPGNGYTITIGGTITPGDVVTAAIETGLVYGGMIAASYTVQTLDDTAAVAAGLKAALVAAIQAFASPMTNNIDSAIAAASFIVTVSASVITIITHSDIPWFNVTKALSGGATITATIAAYNSGLGTLVTGTSLTANGLVQFSTVAQWFKVDATLSAGAANAVVVGYT